MNTDIIQHMERHFGPVQELALSEIVPALDVALHVIPPPSKQDSIILFTTGMSDEPQNVPEGREEYRYTELFMRLPSDWPMSPEAFDNPDNFWPFKWLRQIAAYPRQNDTWLGGPYTIVATDEPPAPLASNTRLSCLLLLRERGEEGTVVCADGRNVILYTVIPIYAEERDLEMSHGLGELLTRFHARGLPLMVDLNRINVARGSQPPPLPPFGPRLVPKQ